MRLVACLAILSAFAHAQVAEKANNNYRTEEGRKNLITTLSDPHRPVRLKAAEFVKALDIRAGDTVADVGSGGGALLPSLSAAVGPSGRIIAEDIFRDFLDRARQTAEDNKLANVMYILGTERETRLPENCCDVIITVDAYHHYDYPAEMLNSIRAALRPNGRFAILDYYKRPNAMGNTSNFALEHIRIDKDDVVKEVESNGFRLAKSWEHVPNSQYVAVFAVK